MIGVFAQWTNVTHVLTDAEIESAVVDLVLELTELYNRPADLMRVAVQTPGTNETAVRVQVHFLFTTAESLNLTAVTLTTVSPTRLTETVVEHVYGEFVDGVFQRCVSGMRSVDRKCVCFEGSEARDGACMACEVGTYKSLAANSSCLTCPGESISGRASVLCTQCPPYMIAIEGHTRCVCGEGFVLFQNECVEMASSYVVVEAIISQQVVSMPNDSVALEIKTYLNNTYEIDTSMVFVTFDLTFTVVFVEPEVVTTTTTSAPTTTPEVETTPPPVTEVNETEAITSEVETTPSPVTEVNETEAITSEVETTPSPVTEANGTEAITSEVETTPSPETEANGTEAITSEVETTPTSEVETTPSSETEVNGTEAITPLPSRRLLQVAEEETTETSMQEALETSTPASMEETTETSTPASMEETTETSTPAPEIEVNGTETSTPAPEIEVNGTETSTPPPEIEVNGTETSTPTEEATETSTPPPETDLQGIETSTSPSTTTPRPVDHYELVVRIRCTCTIGGENCDKCRQLKSGSESPCFESQIIQGEICVDRQSVRDADGYLDRTGTPIECANGGVYQTDMVTRSKKCIVPPTEKQTNNDNSSFIMSIVLPVVTVFILAGYVYLYRGIIIPWITKNLLNIQPEKKQLVPAPALVYPLTFRTQPIVPAPASASALTVRTQPIVPAPFSAYPLSFRKSRQ